jgi:hypothetical protein
MGEHTTHLFPCAVPYPTNLPAAMNLCVTDHALRRARERLRWKPSTLRRMVPRVLRQGLWGNCVPAALRPWLAQTEARPVGEVGVVYGHHRFVFALDTEHGAMVLKTIMPLEIGLCRIADRRRRGARHLRPHIHDA